MSSRTKRRRPTAARAATTRSAPARDTRSWCPRRDRGPAALAHGLLALRAAAPGGPRSGADAPAASERGFEHVDGPAARAVRHHRRDVEAQLRGPHRLRGEPERGRAAAAAAACAAYGLDRRPNASPRRVFTSQNTTSPRGARPRRSRLRAPASCGRRSRSRAARTTRRPRPHRRRPWRAAAVGHRSELLAGKLLDVDVPEGHDVHVGDEPRVAVHVPDPRVAQAEIEVRPTVVCLTSRSTSLAR